MKMVKALLILGALGVGSVCAMESNKNMFCGMDESTVGSTMSQEEGERYGFKQDYHSGEDLRGGSLGGGGTVSYSTDPNAPEFQEGIGKALKGLFE